MAADTLKQKTKKGLYWNAAGNMANQGIRFLVSIVLARLLCPEDYGTIGILTVFIIIISVFIDCGFSQALIHKQNRSQTDFSTEFLFNIVVVLGNYTSELPLRDILCYLCKNELSYMHICSDLYSDAKVSISKSGQGIRELKCCA